MSRAGFRILMLGCALCTAAALQGATKFTDLRAGWILIRNVTGEPSSAPRYRQAFSGVPESRTPDIRG
jgi:hypothetical protein